MTAREFNTFWESTYPEVPPIGYLFRHAYPDRWFRIHSLPESQRYPADVEDWQILLERQNTILTTLLGMGQPLLFVTGDYKSEGFTEINPVNELESIQAYSFERGSPIVLNVYDETYDPDQTCTPLITKQIWQPSKFDAVLRDIAEWRLPGFFVSLQNHCILAPYDGGMDIILNDSISRDFYKAKYSAWLSDREDGL